MKNCPVLPSHRGVVPLPLLPFVLTFLFVFFFRFKKHGRELQAGAATPVVRRSNPLASRPDPDGPGRVARPSTTVMVARLRPEFQLAAGLVAVTIDATRTAWQKPLSWLIDSESRLNWNTTPDTICSFLSQKTIFRYVGVKLQFDSDKMWVRQEYKVPIILEEVYLPFIWCEMS